MPDNDPKVNPRPAESPCLAAALDYLSRSWSPIPLVGKRPVESWDEFQERRPTEAEVRAAWGRHPNTNVGIAMGPVSGMIGLDFDGPEALEMAEELFGAEGLPVTLGFTTPGGGQRLFYSVSSDCPVTKRRWDRKDSDGKPTGSHVIVMGKGAQTVMPPSIHPDTGTAYAWPAALKPLAPAPAHLIELATRKEPTPAPPAARQPHPWEKPGPGGAMPHDEPVNLLERVRLYLRGCPPAISGQGGHAQTFKVALALVQGFQLDERTALALLEEVYNPTCQPPWTVKELEHKLADAAKAEYRNGKAEGYLRDAQRPPPAATTPSAPRATKPVSPTTIEIGNLLAKEYPEPKWAVEGIIPEGGALLAARPKTGKSWLALNIALAVSYGGVALGRVDVERGEVLYLALEDGERRLQDRIKKVLKAQQMEQPAGIYFATTWPRSSAGGLDAIDAFLEAHPQCRLVVIDTVARFRDRGAGQGNAYDEDYAAMAAVQALALRRGVAVLGITHTRKPKGKGAGDDEDPLDEVQNSTGMTGAADAVLVLKRPRGTREGTLFITGRDLEERTLRIGMDPEFCLWSIRDFNADDPDDAIVSQDWKKVRQAIRKAGHGLSPVELAQVLNKDANAISCMLGRMKRAGVLQPEGYGRWTLPEGAPQEARQTATDRQTTVSRDSADG